MHIGGTFVREVVGAMAEEIANALVSVEDEEKCHDEGDNDEEENEEDLRREVRDQQSRLLPLDGDEKQDNGYDDDKYRYDP